MVTLATAIFQIVNTNIQNHPLTYHRSLFIQQFYWQWITPTLVHVNWNHWLLNILNMFALIFLFPEAWSIKSFIIMFAFSSLFIILGLYFISPTVISYVGMSGVLYTFAIYGTLKTYNKQKVVSIGIFIYVLIKLFAGKEINEIMGVNIILSNINVVTDVHWYGAIFGFMYFILYKFKLSK